MARPRLPRSIQELVHWYERYISPLSLVAGFVADNLFLTRRVDLIQTNLLFFFYLIVSASGIVLMNLLESGRIRKQWMIELAPVIPVIVQFAFGGLFSGFLSLYSRSAAYALSWVFVVFVAVLLLGNERFTRLYVRFPFQISVYFTVLFSFFTFFLPVVSHQIGPYMFVGSGLVSLLVITLLLYLIAHLAPEVVQRDQTRVARAIAIIFIVFNILYFSNAIPPLPLALKEGGVYHSIVHNADGSYTLQYEPLPWYEQYLRYNTTIHIAPSDPVFVWTSIFAPSGLSTTIFHQWQHYDVASGKWQTLSTLSYPINGGRDGGYRGYTEKYGLLPGDWRVNVITRYGQIVGRVSFTIVEDTSHPTLLQAVE